MPGWNDHIKPLFEDSLLCHDIWVQNGKPRNGLIAQNMRITRARYHYAILNAIKDESRVRNDKMAEAISQKNDCNLWQEVKKITKSGNVFSNIVETDLFYNKNKELFNSDGYNEQKMSDLKHKIDTMTNKCSTDNVILNVHDIKEAINKLKHGKQEESGLFSDHFLNGPDRLFIIICILFNSMIVHGIAPSDFLVGTMIPIVKDHRKSIRQSNNYRTLTLGTILSKVFRYFDFK